MLISLALTGSYPQGSKLRFLPDLSNWPCRFCGTLRLRKHPFHQLVFCINHFGQVYADTESVSFCKLLCCRHSRAFAVFENDGAGNFSAASVLPSPDLASCAIIHDRDNDGDLDISGTDEGVDVIVLFENQGIVPAEEAAGSLPGAISLLANPCRDNCSLMLDLPGPAAVIAEIFGTQRQLLLRRDFGHSGGGRQQLRLDTRQLPPACTGAGWQPGLSIGPGK